MRRSAPVKLIVHYPKTQQGKQELAGRVAEVHAGFVVNTIQKLDCPTKQKLELLQAIMDTARQNARQGRRAFAEGLSKEVL